MLKRLRVAALPLLLLTAAAAYGFILGIPASPFSLGEGYPARVVHIDHTLTPQPLPAQPTGYRLVFLVASIGVDTPNGHLHVSGGHKGSLVKLTDTGHSWVILEAPGKKIECGLTPKSQNWFTGVGKLEKQGDPDPISYLWKTLPDGRRHGHLTGFHPSFAGSIDLTAEQHASIAKFIDAFDFQTFNLIEHECTNFAVEVARQLGIELDYQIQIDLPHFMHVAGKDHRAWTDPKYSKFIVATPDVLERSLRELVRQGIVKDVTKQY